jgi:LmbE family N-acetylglucosaminyl deacetylase
MIRHPFSVSFVNPIGKFTLFWLIFSRSNIVKRLLVVFAHPDDETAIAGTLAHYTEQGVEVALVCATKGEAGEISDPTLATPENLPAVRERELRCSCDMLGIKNLYLLNYCDSGMEGTAENEKPTAFIRARDEDVQRKLVRIFRDFKPDAVITFEPFGWYGHPDHIAAGKHASAAFHLCGSPDTFPELGEIWQPRRLFHAVLPRSNFKKMVEFAREAGIDLGGFDDFPLDDPDPLEDLITHKIDVTNKQELKFQVMRCHKTQFGEDSLFRRLPLEALQDLWRYEHFIQVSPNVPEENRLGVRLLDGLDD